MSVILPTSCFSETRCIYTRFAWHLRSIHAEYYYCARQFVNDAAMPNCRRLTTGESYDTDAAAAALVLSVALSPDCLQSMHSLDAGFIVAARRPSLAVARRNER